MFLPGPCTRRKQASAFLSFSDSPGKFRFLAFAWGIKRSEPRFGGRVVRARKLMHGKTSRIEHDGKTIFRGLPQKFQATRYHSLIVERKSLPRVLEISAETDDGTIMGLRHRRLRVEGVQFHSESVLTEAGFRLLENFLSV